MELKGTWHDKSPFIKILLLVGFVFVLAALFTFIASFFTQFFFGVDIMKDQNVLQDYHRPEVMDSLKLIQMITSLGIFVFPPIIAAYLISDDATGFLRLKSSAETSTYFLAVIVMIVSLPLINLSIQLNENLNMPEMLKGVEDWMRGSESKAAELTEAFLNTSSVNGLLLNLFMIAVIPAIGEELFFRGYMQRIFGDWLKNAHAAIIITAIIFSTFHMQFFGFLPRAILGVILGYLFYWSGSLWIPIIAHFFNNAAAVIVAYLHFNGHITFDGNEIGIGDNYVLPVITSIIFTCAVLYLIYIKESHKKVPG